MPLTGDPRLWDAATKQGAVFTALSDIPDAGHVPGRLGKRTLKCATCQTAYDRLLPALGEAPLIFMHGGQPLPQGGQRANRLRHFIAEVHAHAFEYRPGDAPTPAPAPAPAPVPTPAPNGTVKLDPNAVRYYKRVEDLRAFAEGRKFDSMESMRIVEDGTKAIMAGLPVEGVLASVTATWSEDTRRQAKVADFDYAGWKAPSDGSHAVSEYVAVLVDAGVNVWLHGPAGTGKSSAARYAADRAGLPYHEVNLAGAMASAIKGKHTIKDWIESEFTKAYRDGGVLCLEEFDAAHPTVATAVNNAIANGHFFNDVDGTVTERSRRFRLICTANTVGTGATTEFTGRMKIDAATRDRFRAGMVYVGRDAKLERSIFERIAAI